MPQTSLSPDASAMLADADALIHRTLDGLDVRLRGLSGGTATTAKRDGTPVTDADFMVDEALRSAISDAFPDHGIVSEEASTTWDGSEWTWIVDPIDGTSNFAAGLPYWAISIAIAHLGTPVYGCVAAPALGERYVGTTGRGATLRTPDGPAVDLAVRTPPQISSGRDSHVPIAVSAGTIRRAKGRAVRLNPRILGAWALDLAMVAAGRLAGSYARVPHVWDVAAGVVLIEEAGGAVHFQGDHLLPLRTEVDYRSASTPVTTGASRKWVDELRRHLPD